MRATLFSRPIQRKRRASALVEFALILPLLLFLILGLIQYGITYNTTLTITNLSRDAARFAAMRALDATPLPAGTTALPNPPDVSTGSTDPDQKIKTYIYRSSRNFGVKYADLTIAITPNNGNVNRQRGNPIAVKVTYDMGKKLFLPAKMGVGRWGITFFQDDYSAETSMAIE
jgi:Flp pilus assembly protein TadG